MALKKDQIPSAITLASAMKAPAPSLSSLSLVKYVCLWMAYENIMAALKLHGGLSPTERAERRSCAGSMGGRQQEMNPVISQMPKADKEALLRHKSTQYFARRVPRWRGQALTSPKAEVASSGVIDIRRTIDVGEPVLASISTSALDRFLRDERESALVDLLMAQVLEILRVVWDNIRHASRDANDATDIRVVEAAMPLLHLTVQAILERAE